MEFETSWPSAARSTHAKSVRPDTPMLVIEYVVAPSSRSVLRSPAVVVPVHTSETLPFPSSFTLIGASIVPSQRSLVLSATLTPSRRYSAGDVGDTGSRLIEFAATVGVEPRANHVMSTPL